MSEIVIRGGRVIDPASGLDATRDVRLRDGVVAEIRENVANVGADAEQIDAEGLIVAPGLIDPHVHLREPGQEHKETIATGTMAAVEGGFTTVCCMPNTSPALDSAERIAWINQRAEETGACRVFAVGACTIERQGDELTDFEAMARAGAVAFSDDGDVVEDDAVMADVLKRCREVERVMMQHCQDPKQTVGATMNDGEVSERMGEVGWPRVAEESIIERDVALAREIGARYHVQHLSSGGSVEIIRKARSEGLADTISAEASPHHLHLTDEACEELGSAAKMNPPLRTAADVEAVRLGVADGTISILATDHAPHTADEKALPFAEAPFGIIGLQTALPLYALALIETGLIGWPRLIELMTVNPARLCGLDSLGLGRLTEGGPADVTLIDPSLDWIIDLGDMAGKSHNSPFDGWETTGRAIRTIVGGETRWSL